MGRVACVQTPLPSVKIGEGALLRFLLRGGGGLYTGYGEGCKHHVFSREL